MNVRIEKFLEFNSWRDWLRILRAPIFFSTEAVKWLMMVDCGCTFNELNNWLSHAIRTPYYWRTPNVGSPFVSAPYSPIWYILNQPARFGYSGYMIYLFVIDLVFSGFVFWTRRWAYVIPYIAGSLYFYNVDPIDLFIFQFALLGMFSPWFSLLAIIVKMPWLPPFAPLYVWSFVLHDPYGLNEPGGIVRYGQLGISWVAGIVLYWWRWRLRHKGPGVTSLRVARDHCPAMLCGLP